MKTRKKIQVIVVMGSRSDLRIMKDAAHLIEDHGVGVLTEILSAHRTPELLESRSAAWEKSGVKVVIAGAGGAAHLPGMLASYTRLPVIGVPVKSHAMDGLDSLLSIAQMPKGVPVATVAVEGAFNAGLLALKILAVEESVLGKRLRGELGRHRKQMNQSVKFDRARLAKQGIRRFLKNK